MRSNSQSSISPKTLHRVRQSLEEAAVVDIDRSLAEVDCLAAVVKEATGTTPMGWLSKYTVLYAESRLTGTKLSVQEISDDLSFPDQSTFGRYFKRVAGVSPKKFREDAIARALTKGLE